MVPNQWDSETLKDLLSTQVKNGYSPNAVEQTTGYVVLGLGALTDHSLDTSHIKNVEVTEQVLRSQLCHGDFLISRSNTPDKVGRSVMFRAEVPNCSYPDLMMKFRPDESRVEPSYLEIYLQSSKARQYFKNCAAGSSSSMVKINKSIVEKTPILLPPLPEQRKIAKILSTWDKAIATTEKLIETSKQQKIALMQQLLTGKKRLVNPETGKTFEREWETKRLGEIGEIKSAGVDKKIIETEVPVRLLNFTDVFRRDFIYPTELGHWVTAPDAKVKNCDVRKGDVFFTPSSETRNEIGIPSVAAEDIPECCYSYHIIRFRINEKWDLNFKAYAFSTGEFRRQAYKLGDGSGQRYVISQDGFRGIEVKYPEYEEQVVIGKVLKNSEDTIQALKLKLAHFKQEKKALMQQLLTGKRRVKVDDMEVA